MSQIRRETVPAGLSVSVQQGNEVETTVLVRSGEIVISVQGGKPTVDESMIETIQAMENEAQQHAGQAYFTWKLYLGFGGRLWTIEGVKDGDPKSVTIEYVDITDIQLSASDGQPYSTYDLTEDVL